MSLTSTPSVGRIVRRRRAALAVSAACSLLSSAAALAPAVAVYLVAKELFVDRPEADSTRIVWIAIGTALALIARSVLGAVSTHLAHLAAYRILADLRLALVDQLGRAPLGAIESRPLGEVKKVVQDDVEQLEETIAHGVPDAAAAAGTPIAALAVLSLIDWRLALVLIGTLLVVLVFSGLASALAARHNRGYMDAVTALNVAVPAYLRGMPVIRGFVRPEAGYTQVRDAVRGLRDAQESIADSRLRWLANALPALTGLFALATIAVGGSLAVRGSIDTATVILFSLLSLGFAAPIFTFVLTTATLTTRFRMAAESITDLLGLDPLPTAVHPLAPTGDDVQLDAVTFGYGDRAVLHDVSVRLEPGTLTAVVGPSGAGKSTLARLVARFWDVDAGAVRVGGADVREIDAAELSRHIAVVQQDDYLFDDTIVENIRLGRPDATDAEVIDAGRRARVDLIADELPDGWQSRTGAGGSRLSGGQRQRISVARALLKDAPIVLLDEPTAFLDAENEAATSAAVANLAVGRTVLVVAHRLATVTDADQIIVLDDGRVADRGRHEELVERCVPYQRLWTAHQASAGWHLASGTTPPAPLPEVAVPAGRDEESQAAADVVRPHLDQMSAGRQWRTLIGRFWPVLLRRGLWRLVLEGVVRSAPVAAVYLLLVALLDGNLTTARVGWLSLGLAVALALRVVAAERATQVTWRVNARATGDLMLSVLDRLRLVPLAFLDRFDTGRTTTLVTNDLPLLDFQNTPQQVAGAVVQPIVSAVVLAFVDWRLALAALIGLPAFYLLTAVADRHFARTFGPLHRVRAEATSQLIEQIRGTAVLRAYPDSAQARRYRDVVERLRAASVEMSVRAAPAVAASTLALELGTVAVIVLGAGLYAAGTVGPTTLLLFLVLSLVMYQPLSELAGLAGYRRTQQQIAQRLAQVWDEPVLPEPSEPSSPSDASLELRDVTFAYPGGEPVLRGVSFTARPGTVTALIGPSGAGKSTIAHLAGRFVDPSSGQVLLGGQDLRDLGTATVMAHVSTVYQDVHLFAGTIRSNVTIGRPDALDDEIWSALESAQCRDDVERLDGRLDATVDEGGQNLSGGQRQRLSIARALLKDSPIVILDEAVAAVDPETEDRIQRALAALVAGRTVIVVAHRLSTVTRVDQIVCLAGGVAEAVGSHEHVLATSPTYARLWRAHRTTHLVAP